MLKEIPYNRDKTVEYAQEWAMKRNPRYISFDGMGGDCTNFASQCVYAGCEVMNYTQSSGWYYNSPDDRTPSWSGVEFLHDFLVANHSTGPYAVEAGPEDIRPGDLVQLGDATGHFYHTPVVVDVNRNGIYVAAHTYDAFQRPLNSYFYDRIRYLHIAGARQWK